MHILAWKIWDFNLGFNCKLYWTYILVIRLDCAQSVLTAKCSVIVTECNVVHTEALLYMCEKFKVFQEAPKRKFSAYGKPLN